MRPRELREWAKEIMVDAVDRYLDNDPDRHEWDADDREALLRERNRVAKLLFQPKRRSI